MDLILGPGTLHSIKRNLTDNCTFVHTFANSSHKLKPLEMDGRSHKKESLIACKIFSESVGRGDSWQYTQLQHFPGHFFSPPHHIPSLKINWL